MENDPEVTAAITDDIEKLKEKLPKWNLDKLKALEVKLLEELKEHVAGFKKALDTWKDKRDKLFTDTNTKIKLVREAIKSAENKKVEAVLVLAALHQIIGEDRRKKSPEWDDDDLLSAIKFMEGAGLVPTGSGKPTLPSRVPPFSIIWDKDEKKYFLVTDYGGKGDIWEIQTNGDSEFVGGYKGTFHPGPNQDEYSDAEFADYVELAVIQEVYGLLDPEFDEPREGEDFEPPGSKMNN